MEIHVGKGWINKNNKVIKLNKIDESEYVSVIKGTNNYNVHLNTDFPEEATNFEEEQNRLQEEYEKEQEEQYK